jgi:hypothetical protein
MGSSQRECLLQPQVEQEGWWDVLI